MEFQNNQDTEVVIPTLPTNAMDKYMPSYYSQFLIQQQFYMPNILNFR